jgi:hypothetical protein
VLPPLLLLLLLLLVRRLFVVIGGGVPMLDLPGGGTPVVRAIGLMVPPLVVVVVILRLSLSLLLLLLLLLLAILPAAPWRVDVPGVLVLLHELGLVAAFAHQSVCGNAPPLPLLLMLLLLLLLLVWVDVVPFVIAAVT